MTAGEPPATAAAAREHLRAYAARIDDLEAGMASPAAERAALEDALDHAARALAFAVGEADDGAPPTAAFGALADLAREAGVEPGTAGGMDLSPPAPSLPATDHAPESFERWLVAGVPALIGASLPCGGAVIGDALERAYDDYERAAPGDDGSRVERLGSIVPLLETLYGLYVRAAVGEPDDAAPEAVARATLSLALVATAGAGRA